MSLVVCSYLPGEGHFRSRVAPTVPIVCAGEFDYWYGLNAVWGTGRTLVNVEHDIAATDDHVRALVGCPHPLCSWAYECHWASTGQPRSLIAAGALERDPVSHQARDYLRGGETWAAWSSIGLVKVTRAARTGSLRRESWQRVELAVADAVRGPWHMHWPLVAHHHW